MVRRLAYEVVLVATDGDRLAALQALSTRQLALVDPASVGQMLYDLAPGQ